MIDNYILVVDEVVEYKNKMSIILLRGGRMTGVSKGNRRIKVKERKRRKKDCYVCQQQVIEQVM